MEQLEILDLAMLCVIKLRDETSNQERKAELTAKLKELGYLYAIELQKEKTPSQ